MTKQHHSVRFLGLCSLMSALMISQTAGADPSGAAKISTTPAEAPSAEPERRAGASGPGEAGEAPMEAGASPFAKLDWESGPGVGALGRIAEVKIPEGFIFGRAQTTQSFLKLTGNIPSELERGMLLNPEEEGWFVIFDYEGVGYVKDDERDTLDAAEIMETMRAGQVESNTQREALGLYPLYIEGWALAPTYNAETNNLEWAVRLRSDAPLDEGETEEDRYTINHQTRLLGRGGVMSATLVVKPSTFEQIMPSYRAALSGYAYAPGHRYGEFRSGDQVAEYGLTGLVVGGAAVAAAKSGLLGKIWKILVFGLVAVGAGFRRFFQR